MRYQRFGTTGRDVAVIGQGTWYIEDADRRAAVAALRRGLDLGMNHIDTAEMYGDGAAERIVGEAIAGRRDEVFLVSKVLPHNASRAGTVAACERSLARLATDRIDCYLLHWRGAYPLAETIAAFAALQQAGKIRAWGVSNFDVDDLEEAEAVAGPGRMACDQVLYHLQERDIEHAVIAWCEGHGVAVTAYSPFGHGSFPGPRSPCFYGAKALCYLLGFASVGRSSKLYIDAFYETERKVGKQRLKVIESLRFHRLDDRLTHEVLWALTARLIDTTVFDESLRSWQTRLKLTDWENFSAFRNKVFYDGGFWPRRSDRATCDLARDVHDRQIAAAALLDRSEASTPFANEYFMTARSLRYLITEMIENLAELSPALATEVLAFNSLRPDGGSGVVAP